MQRRFLAAACSTSWRLSNAGRRSCWLRPCCPAVTLASPFADLTAPALTWGTPGAAGERTGSAGPAGSQPCAGSAARAWAGDWERGHIHPPGAPEDAGRAAASGSDAPVAPGTPVFSPLPHGSLAGAEGAVAGAQGRARSSVRREGGTAGSRGSRRRAAGRPAWSAPAPGPAASLALAGYSSPGRVEAGATAAGQASQQAAMAETAGLRLLAQVTAALMQRGAAAPPAQAWTPLAQARARLAQALSLSLARRRTFRAVVCPLRHRRDRRCSAALDQRRPMAGRREVSRRSRLRRRAPRAGRFGGRGWSCRLRWILTHWPTW